MATLGVRRFEDLIGRTELLEMDEAIDHWKARGVDLSMVLSTARHARGRSAPPDAAAGPGARRRARLGARARLRARARAPASRCGSDSTALGPVPVRNVNRTVGGILSGEIARRRGARGLPEGTIEIAFCGSAGQSFAAWLAPGVTFSLRGETNDYTGKGLSGGVVSVRPPERGAVPRRGEHDRRQHRAVRRDRRARVLPRAGRRAVRGPQLGRARGRRGGRRPRLRVHDRRARGRARSDRAGTSPPG